MSFSGEVKEELMKHTPPARHCQLAELASILHFCGSHTAAEGSNNLQNEEKKSIFNVEKLLIQAENEAVIRKCFTLLKKTFNINTSVNEKESERAEKQAPGPVQSPGLMRLSLRIPLR